MLDADSCYAQRVTTGPQYHWFGYYDMPCWDVTGRRLLSLGVDFEDRPPAAEDQAVIGLTDLETGAYRVLAETRAFNWQQGAMLHWLPGDSGRRIIYNDRQDGRFVSIVLDVDSGERYMAGRATSDVGLEGHYALGLNFARIAQMRPGYGYAGLGDPWENELHPTQDGVWVMDLEAGSEWLAVSMAQVFEYLGRPPEVAQAQMWFNHTLLNPSETRLAWLVRWPVEGRPAWRTVMFTADVDGGNLRAVLADGMVSHFDWRDDEHILAWTRIGQEGDHYYLVNERTGEYQIVGREQLNQDGHCSYARGQNWILTDTYPDPITYERTLKIFLPDEQRQVIVGRYDSPPPFVGELRCDLHPRWSRDNRWICFDSVHEGHRQVYVVRNPLCE